MTKMVVGPDVHGVADVVTSVTMIAVVLVAAGTVGA